MKNGNGIIKALANAVSMVTIPSGVVVGATSLEGGILLIIGFAIQLAKYYKVE